MVPEDLFSLALGLVPPWLVDHVTFTVEEKRLDLHINFPKGRRFACPVCGEACPVNDTRDHTAARDHPTGPVSAGGNPQQIGRF